MSYNMNDIIYKKREGGKLSKDEIEYFIKGYVAGDIPDYQASALLMAIFFRGLDREETFRLTNAMRYSGDTIDLSSIKGVKVDKHSTGGVGDKTTLIVAPLASACGVPIAKMSGRGLGFTGGTVDKMESIPGFRTSLEPEEFLNQVNTIGMAVIGQTAHITPADKKLYALRDVTATVDNFGLIASSIMSKKLAAGSDAIVLDVKVGDGAFMENLEDAVTLADLMVDIGRNAGRRTVAAITEMGQPLGCAVGNALEVIAAIGGNPAVGEDYSLFPQAAHKLELKAETDGYVARIAARCIGLASQHTGAGRATKEDTIDLSAGIYVHKKVGDAVSGGDILATFYGNDAAKLDNAIEEARKAFVISPEKVERPKLIKEIIGL